MKRMLRFITLQFFLIMFLEASAQLKAVVYDFDGLDIGQTNLPEGDYGNYDLTYEVSENPLGNSDMLGDRVLKLKLNWSQGKGEFGRGISRFIEFDAAADRLNFYFYNPPSNPGPAVVDVMITEDDDKDNTYNEGMDDRWVRRMTLPVSPRWELIPVPLTEFTDDNTGGNGIFDAAYTNAAGMLFKVSFIFQKTGASSAYEEYFMDMICFSEGPLPTGATILDLPPRGPSDTYCLLGAFSKNSEINPAEVPGEVENLFPHLPGKRMYYVNWFLPFSKNGKSEATLIPGKEVDELLARGYTPIITWEPLYTGPGRYRLDPGQPRLQNILNGEFDAYFDAFGDRMRTVKDTVIVRLMHEFEGDWYPWSLTENKNDPNMYIAAYRKIVDRVRARGASRIKWMWCVNADPKPYRAYNWIISAYPGDGYVDIVATDIYNHPDLGTPDWKSFKYTGIESYYYLTKYYPHKPFFICEVASRERKSWENPGSQTKAGWMLQMEKEIQSTFGKTRALVFFSAVKEHEWPLNSSPSALDAVTITIWNDHYYFNKPNSTSIFLPDMAALKVYPNPFREELNVFLSGQLQGTSLQVYDVMGKMVLRYKDIATDRITLGETLPDGLYILEFQNENRKTTFKVVKQAEKEG